MEANMNSQSLFNTIINNKVDDKINTIALKVVMVVACSLGIAASAQVSFYIPSLSPVPFTMQTFAVMLIALTTGRRVASLAVVTYLVECALGLPFLAGGSALITITASTGYLFGFIPMAYVIGSLADTGFANCKLGMVVTLLLGNFMVYLFGSMWMGQVIGFNKPILQMAVIPFIAIDTLKAFVAIVVSKVFYSVARK